MIDAVDARPTTKNPYLHTVTDMPNSKKETTPTIELIRVTPEKVPFLAESVDDSINRHISYLSSRITPILEKHPDTNYEEMIGGENIFSCLLKKGIDLDQIHKEFQYPTHIDFKNGLSTPLNTGVDLNYLINQFPNDRWKFYLSLDTQTPEKSIKAQSFIKELILRCKQHHISLLAKAWKEHDYDNPDIYTWQPMSMAKILQELYTDPKFSGIWFDTLHYLQKPIDGISPDHIGLVQEPINGLNGKSHSIRMSFLGEAIDKKTKISGRPLGFHIFVESANIAGVYPSEPWRIQEQLL